MSRLPWDGFPSALTLKDQPGRSDDGTPSPARAALVQRAGIGVNFGIVADVTDDRSMFIYRRALGTSPGGGRGARGRGRERRGRRGDVHAQALPGSRRRPGRLALRHPVDGDVEGRVGGDRRRAVPGGHRRRCAAADVRPPRVHRGRPRAGVAVRRVAPHRPRRTRVHRRQHHRRSRDAAGLGHPRAIRIRSRNAVAALAAGNDMVLAVMFSTADSAPRIVDGIVAAVDGGHLPAGAAGRGRARE